MNVIFWWGVFCGGVAGVFCGVLIMALLAMSGRCSDQEDAMERMHLADRP